MAMNAVSTAARLGVSIKVQPANDHPGLGAGDPALKTNRALPHDRAAHLRRVLDELKAAPNVVNSDTFLEGYWSFLFDQDSLPLARRDCLYGFHHMELLGDEIFPCLEGMGWKNGFSLKGSSLSEILSSEKYAKRVKALRRCRGCKKNYYVCYYEPRIHFPLHNLVGFRLKKQRGTNPA